MCLAHAGARARARAHAPPAHAHAHAHDALALAHVHMHMRTLEHTRMRTALRAGEARRGRRRRCARHRLSPPRRRRGARRPRRDAAVLVALVAAALDSGSDDNISVVIAENGEVPRVSQGTMPLDFVRSPDDDLGSVTGEDSIAPSTEQSDADQPDSTMVGWTAEDADGNAADSDAGEVLAAVHETEALEAVESAAVLPVAAIVAAIVLVGAVIAFLVL